jgi:enoyl-[acyl-carrier protein] reductase II
MVRTQLCTLLDIDVPVIQASLGPWAGAELAASVSNAGGLGTIGPAMQPVEKLRADLQRIGELTSRPFAVDHALGAPGDEALDLSLASGARAIWLRAGHPKLVERVHDAGAMAIQQVHTVEQAKLAAESGADVVVANGGEGGAMVLVAQVVDAVRPLPVIAAGGVTDGRTIAAAIMLGAHGASVGTHLLAAAANRNGQTAGFVRGIVEGLVETAEDCLRRGVIAVG